MLRKLVLTGMLLLCTALVLVACGGDEQVNHTLDIRNTGDSKIILSRVVVDGTVYHDTEMLLDLGRTGVQMGREYQLDFVGGKKVEVEYTLIDPQSRGAKTFNYTFTDTNGEGGTFFIEFMNWKPIYKTSSDGKGIIPLMD